MFRDTHLRAARDPDTDRPFTLTCMLCDRPFVDNELVMIYTEGTVPTLTFCYQCSLKVSCAPGTSLTLTHFSTEADE